MANSIIQFKLNNIWLTYIVTWSEFIGIYLDEIKSRYGAAVEVRILQR